MHLLEKIELNYRHKLEIEKKNSSLNLERPDLEIDFNFC